MAAEAAQVKPINKIVLDSTGIHLQTKKVETATNMYPGRLVKKGTNDDDVIAGAAATDKVYGWIGYEHTHKNYRPATVDTIQVINDQITVINGPGIILNAFLELGATVVKGDYLTCGALGGLTGMTLGSTSVVCAIAEESDIPAAGGVDLLVRSML
jgi:hypothetical protein